MLDWKTFYGIDRRVKEREINQMSFCPIKMREAQDWLPFRSMVLTLKGKVNRSFFRAVQPVKSRQMSIKVAQNDFTRKIKDFHTFRKIA